MKTIIAGSRWICHYILVETAVCLSGFNIEEVVSGTNGTRDINDKVIRGVDLFGEQWAKEHDVPVQRFPADWDQYGKRAGFIRNAEMADYADALIAVWDGTSPGTNHMINRALKKGLPTYVYRLDGEKMLHLTENAAQKVLLLMEMNGLEEDKAGVKIGVKAGGCSGLEYTLDIVEEPDENDRIFESEGVRVFCHPKAYLYIRGTTVDHVDSTMESGFKFDNPNAKRSCGCGTSFTT